MRAGVRRTWAYLGVPEALAGFAEYLPCRHPYVVVGDLSVTAWRVAVEGVKDADNLNTGRIVVHHEHGCTHIITGFIKSPGHKNLKRCPGHARDQPFSSIDNIVLAIGLCICTQE